jgi:hypothetical protein
MSAVSTHGEHPTLAAVTSCHSSYESYALACPYITSDIAANTSLIVPAPT